jgi:hypothetical protein
MASTKINNKALKARQRQIDAFLSERATAVGELLIAADRLRDSLAMASHYEAHARDLLAELPKADSIEDPGPEYEQWRRWAKATADNCFRTAMALHLQGHGCSE